MNGLTFDTAHLLAGGLVLVSFMMLYQDRLYALLNVFALHALVLALSVAWQAYIQEAPHLYVTAAIALVFKAIVIPVDNPATHLELTMVHEAMVLEYSGRHLAMIEFASSLRLLLYMSLIACVFVPWGLAPPDAGPLAYLAALGLYAGKLAVGGVLLGILETATAKMRVFRVPEFLGAALMLGLLGTLLLFVSRSL